MSFERELRAATARGLPDAALMAVSGEIDVEPDWVSIPRGAVWSFWDTTSRVDLPAEQWLGVGAAAVVSTSGATRFEEARRQLAALMASIDGARAGFVRAFGGAAFEPGNLGPFAALGELCFVVPRWTFSRAHAGTRVTLVAEPAELSTPSRLLEELRPLLTRRSRRLPGLNRVADDGKQRFVEAAREAVRSVEAHSLDKVVVARRAVLDGAIEPLSLLDALAEEVSVTRFALSVSGTTFVGASPELLIALDGQRARSEAVAGTLRRGRDPLELRESGKDQREHAYVVHAIGAALESAGVELTAGAEPVIRSLRHVHHLVTPIEGRLGTHTHVLELVAALHPTPAVLGVPAQAAREFLRRVERIERGWFAAPVGYVDALGQGKFVVALRSALIDRGRAWVFAGSGIVRGSVVEAELAETDAKLTAILAALRTSELSAPTLAGAP